MTRRKNRRKPPVPQATEYQAQALRDITDIASRHAGELVVLEMPRVLLDGTRVLHVAVDTAKLPPRAPKGVKFEAVEQFFIHLEPAPNRPPAVTLDHWRFLGVAHVMSGVQICLYLDPSRDWDPEAGIRGVLNRLWRWMEDAAADRFRPQDALYHAVGSVAHITPGAPTVVIRDLPDRGRHLDALYVLPRSDNRLDLAHGPPQPADLHTPVIRLRRDIPIGAGGDVLADLLRRLELTQGLRPVWPEAWITAASWRLFTRAMRHETLAEYAIGGLTCASDSDCGLAVRTPLWGRPDVNAALDPIGPVAELAAAVVASALRNPEGSHQYAILTVPHPNGGPHHLLCLRISREVADSFRSAAAQPGVTIDPYKVVEASPGMAMEWCRVSDERPQVTTRRDVGRPVETLQGTVVHIWGVGGLGSWIAEFVVRAGARRVLVHDPGHVTGGLLVRQNFVENDIGAQKDEALATRLRGIRDDVEVVRMCDLPQEQVVANMLSADLVVDATVSRVAGRLLDTIAAASDRRAVFAHVATDARTGTRGLVIVSAPPQSRWADVGEGSPTSADIDEQAGGLVASSSSLESYRVFWEEPLPGDEFVPTRGCSVPTFHGSAADLAALAGSMLNVIAMHIGQSRSGTHLISLPHSGVTPSHHFMPHASVNALPSAIA